MSEDDGMTSTDADTTPELALRIVRGNATAEETAAVVVAMAAVRSAPAGPGGRDPRPAWTAAARLEAAGARRVTSRADLTAP